VFVVTCGTVIATWKWAIREAVDYLPHVQGAFFALKRNIEAERLLKRALRIARKTHSHPSLASMLHNLGVVERSLQRALVITERILDPEHPFVAASLDRLGFLYEDLHRYERAETLFSRSLAIREKAFGPDHPEVAASRDNLARLSQLRAHRLDRYGGRNENFVRVWRRPGHPAGSSGGISRAKPLAS
jgi:tetratricopeptide (TPR) repeat protein